mmetsp:Transcript_22101/g.45348  ORF Transcript_22101/g.45348 Transcript_22101/m.45348 type:complete len:225 (-) Transcript_22101:593-1267(-)
MASASAIFVEVHNKRYVLAAEAPICKEPLLGEFGQFSLRPAAAQVLAGTYNYVSVDQATADKFASATDIRSLIPENSVSTTVMPGDWRYYWQNAKENTSSSESGLHFGHYKAITTSTYLTHFHAAKTTVALHLGTSVDRGRRGVTVMLEKELGKNLASKLRAILLMEADFNAANKLIYGNRLGAIEEMKFFLRTAFGDSSTFAGGGIHYKTPGMCQGNGAAPAA